MYNLTSSMRHYILFNDFAIHRSIMARCVTLMPLFLFHSSLLSASVDLDVLTWHTKVEAVVPATGFGDDEEVAENTHSDDEDQQDHSCYGETNQSSKTEETIDKPLMRA